MIASDRINGLLDGLARRFEEEAEDPGAWGQFLDAPKRHRQTGIYGTSAGLITLAVAARGNDVLTRRAADQLATWWASRRENHFAQRVVQNIRLAFMCLALRLASSEPANTVALEIRDELMSRLLPSGLWGDYWVSADRHDQTPRTFTSAITLLLLSLRRPPDVRIDDSLVSVANRLEQRLAADDTVPSHEIAAVAAAVLAIKGNNTSRSARRRFARAGRASPPGLDDQGVYFFDYEYQVGDDLKYGRDYFIVPTLALLALAGFQPGAPTSLRLLAENSLALLADNMTLIGGSFRSKPGARISTVDQAWAALLLEASLIPPESPGFIRRCGYELVRVRKPGWFFGTAFPIAAMVITLTLSNLITSMNRQMQAEAQIWKDVVANLATFVVGGIYGARFVQRVFPGRQ